MVSHGGQRTSVKCAEAAWNKKAGGVVHSKSPAFFFFFIISYKKGLHGARKCMQRQRNDKIGSNNNSPLHVTAKWDEKFKFHSNEKATGRLL